ncbi:MAG: SpoIIE family protein phosphatase [Deltaproteobacteria bacterium]|nr:SpoIIE family protein phosphatase [Deltaproteobacteria bacterium]MBW2120565.1 SpoIIE family protein phosphatase [Deltaproteobacteria bacterium]
MIDSGDFSMSFSRERGGFAVGDECYRKLFQGLQDMVFLTTPSGDLLEVNPMGIEGLGYSDKAEITEFPMVRHYANPEDRSRLAALLRERGSVKDFETRLVKKNRQEIDVWITAHARKDGTGRIVYYEKTVKDITDRKKLEGELREKNRLLEQYYLELRREKDQIQQQAGRLARAVAEADEAKRIIEEQHQKIVAELDMAAKLQRSLLPRRHPQRKGFRFATKYVPSNRIGGDFFDILEVGEGRLGVVIADVSGHGPAAALLTTMFKIYFEMYAQEIQSPNQVLAELNREFCRLITTGEYITGVYLVLDTNKGRVTYSKAGHPYPILYRKRSQSHEFLDTDGFFIGMFEEAEFENRETFLEKGDRLLLYTDGVIEARNPEGSCFETRYLQDILAEGNGLSCSGLMEEIYRRLSRFTGKDRFEDDLCMVLVSVEA